MEAKSWYAHREALSRALCCKLPAIDVQGGKESLSNWLTPPCIKFPYTGRPIILFSTYCKGNSWEIAGAGLANAFAGSFAANSLIVSGV